MSETIYQDESGVLVTAAVVRIGEETYSTPNITSVRVKSTSVLAQIVVIVACVFFAKNLIATEHYYAALFFVGIALVVMLSRAKLFIATAGGERRALASSERHCKAIRDAIVRAMQAAR
jgi:hypothetical protein